MIDTTDLLRLKPQYQGEFSLDTKRTSVTVVAVLLLLRCAVYFPQKPAHSGEWRRPTTAALASQRRSLPTPEKFHEPVCPVERPLGNRIMDQQPLPDAFFNIGARCLSSRPIIDETHATHPGRSSLCQKFAVSRERSSWVTGEDLTRCDRAIGDVKGLWISLGGIHDSETQLLATKFFVQVATFQCFSVEFQTTRLRFVPGKGFPTLWRQTQTHLQQCFPTWETFFQTYNYFSNPKVLILENKNFLKRLFTYLSLI